MKDLSHSFYNKTYSDVIQIEVHSVPLALNFRTELPNFLFILLKLGGTQPADIQRLLVTDIGLQEIQHQLQTVPVQVHVESVLTQHKHYGRRAQSQTLQ